MSGEQLNAASLARVEAITAGLSEDMKDVKTAMREVAHAINRMAVMEERQSQDRAALGRAFGAIEKLGTRIVALEQAQPALKQTSDWVHKAVGQVLTVVTAAVAGGVISAQVARAPEPKTPAPQHQAQKIEGQ